MLTVSILLLFSWMALVLLRQLVRPLPKSLTDLELAAIAGRLF
jgi:hypothetical protein